MTFVSIFVTILATFILFQKICNFLCNLLAIADESKIIRLFGALGPAKVKLNLGNEFNFQGSQFINH